MSWRGVQDRGGLAWVGGWGEGSALETCQAERAFDKQRVGDGNESLHALLQKVKAKERKLRLSLFLAHTFTQRKERGAGNGGGPHPSLFFRGPKGLPLSSRAFALVLLTAAGTEQEKLFPLSAGPS